MILILSIIGILGLLFLEYYIYKRDNSNIKIRQFILSNKFFEVLIELIIIVLGATIAINFSNLQEQKKDKEKSIALLKAAKVEIEESYNMNKHYISMYDEKKIGLGELKYNTSYNISTLNKIIDNDTVMVTITPLSYRIFCNNLDNANKFNTLLMKADAKDENIYRYVNAIDSHLENILFEINNEILHLKGRSTEKNLEKKYSSYIKLKYKRIDGNVIN